MRSNAVVLCSGGLDSATLVYHLHHKGLVPTALLFDYGQRHIKEILCAEKVCRLSHTPSVVVDLSNIRPLISKGSQSGDEMPPEGHYTEMSMKTTIVPNRNAIMLSIACGFAITRGISEVFFAAHSGDHTIYPDCRPDFVHAFDKAMQIGNAWNPVRVFAPFASWTKAQIAREAFMLEVPIAETWSCYKGLALHCGKCGTCVERREAFELAGVEDPTLYAEV